MIEKQEKKYINIIILRKQQKFKTKEVIVTLKENEIYVR